MYTSDQKKADLLVSGGRVALLTVTTVVVFGCSMAWICYIVAISLWAFVLGDDFQHYGPVALALGIPLSLVVTYKFVRRAKRRQFNQWFILLSLASSILLLMLFFICISA